MTTELILHPQVIEQDGRPIFAVLSWEDWQAVQAVLEDRADAAVVADFEARRAAGEETIPGEVVRRICVDDENPLFVLRKWRGFTQAKLARAAGLNQGYISELEGGKKTPSVEALRALARALNVDLDLLPPPED